MWGSDSLGMTLRALAWGAVMRSVVAALVLLLGVSAASAQYIPGAVEKWCKEATEAKAKLTLLQNRYSLLTNSRDVLFFAGAEAEKAGNYDWYRELDGAADRQDERAYRLYREMVGLEATVAHFNKFCTDEIAQQSSVQLPQEKRTATNGTVKRNTALIPRREPRDRSSRTHYPMTPAARSISRTCGRA